MKTLLKRLASETPRFWKRIMWFGGVLTVLSAALIAAPEGVMVPEWLQRAAGYAATAGFVITALANATTTDSELSEK